jgi:hypothetical protein
MSGESIAIACYIFDISFLAATDAAASSGNTSKSNLDSSNSMLEMINPVIYSRKDDEESDLSNSGNRRCICVFSTYTNVVQIAALEPQPQRLNLMVSSPCSIFSD